ncbi:MAG: hypothetical protein ABIB04_02335 [Patescibacteria group bacterium]
MANIDVSELDEQESGVSGMRIVDPEDESDSVDVSKVEEDDEDEDVDDEDDDEDEPLDEKLLVVEEIDPDEEV